MSAVASSVPRRAFRLLRWVALFAVFLVLLPYLLTPIYLVAPPVSTLMLWRWATGTRVERTYVPLQQVAPALPLSVMAAEDARFCHHHGIDWRGLREALNEADTWDEARGGSTITQQVAKNLFLWHSRSVLRKALELPLAMWIDLVLPKRRIMEIYLNIAEWGPTGQFGAEAGSQHAFGKSAEALNVREAALLAAILPNPRRRSAKSAGPGVRRLAGIYTARARTAARQAGCLGLGRRP
ncbi:MAG TPA: monofunctional biosynthetic peptidoglycan transglycosylase [Xanthobacteraceae bacterium]|nr:monofunctional biosynthetic peptidoglycan transglycosylase [Xanthobacteraceae bacterium]